MYLDLSYVLGFPLLKFCEAQLLQFLQNQNKNGKKFSQAYRILFLAIKNHEINELSTKDLPLKMYMRKPVYTNPIPSIHKRYPGS